METYNFGRYYFINWAISKNLVEFVAKQRPKEDFILICRCCNPYVHLAHLANSMEVWLKYSTVNATIEHFNQFHPEFLTAYTLANV